MPKTQTSSSLDVWARQGLRRLEQWSHKLLQLAVHIGTFPYYRIFHFNTYRPIVIIAKCTSSTTQHYRLATLIDRWKTRKRNELHFVSIASAILAAAVIGSFSWTAIPDAYWLAQAFWYCSLVLSILGILLSAQQIAVLDLLTARHGEGKLSDFKTAVRSYLPLMLTEVKRNEGEMRLDSDEIGTWRPRWKMVFTWQCPIMFLAYSVCFFLAGLTVFVCTPLIRGKPWGTDSNVAVFYLSVCAIAGGTFMFCSFWIYHYIDLEDDDREDSEIEPASIMMSMDRASMTQELR